jgi:hypothetical protein
LGLALTSAAFVGMLWLVSQPYGLEPLARGFRSINWQRLVNSAVLIAGMVAMQVGLVAATRRMAVRSVDALRDRD